MKKNYEIDIAPFVATANELIDLGTEHQWWLTSQEETTRHMCLLMEEFNTAYEVLLAKKVKPICDQAFRSKKQFTGNTRDKRAF